MIRRDYILRMIEECIRALMRMNSLKEERRWGEASGVLDEEFQRLLGCDAKTASRLSESELLARLMQDGPTQALRDKTLILTTLLKEAGEVAAAENRADESGDFYVKALHLLLEVLAQGEVFECPEFVPKIEMLLAALESTDLPVRTYAMLMQHYERTGEFAKAEDALFSILDGEAGNAAIAEFGRAFYQRLLAQNDATLLAANLPRAEVEAGLKDLESRLRTPASQSTSEAK
jgi:hypothetical protein